MEPRRRPGAQPDPVARSIVVSPFSSIVARWVQDRRAVTAIEYAVLLAVMSAVALALYPTIGQELSTLVAPMSSMLPP